MAIGLAPTPERSAPRHPAALALLLGASVLVTPGHASEGGFSNYIPGFYGDVALATAPPAGLSLRNDLFFYNGDAARSVRSGSIVFESEVTLVYDYVTFLYNPGFEVLGAQVAFGATPAIGRPDFSADLTTDGLQAGVSDDRAGLGDTTLSGNLYWQRDKLHIMWANFIVAPTGRYDEDDLANTGLNYWTFETDVAATYLDTERGQDYSVVVGYSYNTENNATDYQSGDEFHVDVVLNQFFSEGFGVGLTGFYYRQLSGDSGDGALLGDFKGEAAGIGPAVYYSREIGSREVFFSLKWLHEFNVEKRFEGDYLYASFALTF